jgi:hypothetical protein
MEETVLEAAVAACNRHPLTLLSAANHQDYDSIGGLTGSDKT